MLKFIGIILAFVLGYMTAYNELLAYLLQEKTALYILLALGGSFLLIYVPLERIVETESIQNPSTAFRTSAREHLQRRDSF